MIVWQLMNILSKDKKMIEELSVFLPEEKLQDSLVIEFLRRSEETFSVCLDGNLRANPTRYAFDIKVEKELNAIEAYQRFGGQALSEVIDYGSWKIPNELL